MLTIRILQIFSFDFHDNSILFLYLCRMKINNLNYEILEDHILLVPTKQLFNVSVNGNGLAFPVGKW